MIESFFKSLGFLISGSFFFYKSFFNHQELIILPIGLFCFSLAILVISLIGFCSFYDKVKATIKKR